MFQLHERMKTASDQTNWQSKQHAQSKKNNWSIGEKSYLIILHEATQAFMPEFDVVFLLLAFHNSHIAHAIHM